MYNVDEDVPTVSGLPIYPSVSGVYEMSLAFTFGLIQDLHLADAKRVALRNLTG